MDRRGHGCRPIVALRRGGFRLGSTGSDERARGIGTLMLHCANDFHQASLALRTRVIPARSAAESRELTPKLGVSPADLLDVPGARPSKVRLTARKASAPKRGRKPSRGPVKKARS